jgi:hypothetical protein
MVTSEGGNNFPNFSTAKFDMAKSAAQKRKEQAAKRKAAAAQKGILAVSTCCSVV